MEMVLSCQGLDRFREDLLQVCAEGRSVHLFGGVETAENCFRQWIEAAGDESLDDLEAISFHVPFPKMVKKAVVALGESLGWSEEDALAFYATKVEPTTRTRRSSRDSYSAADTSSVPDGSRMRLGSAFS